ncbi:MAG TPA: hypothetical protein VKS21_12340 [Spirochaetota bacterium]|nr:hypothetical protein [Spirochaetota bacterium]
MNKKEQGKIILYTAAVLEELSARSVHFFTNEKHLKDKRSLNIAIFNIMKNHTIDLMPYLLFIGKPLKNYYPFVNELASRLIKEKKDQKELLPKMEVNKKDANFQEIIFFIKRAVYLFSKNNPAELIPSVRNNEEALTEIIQKVMHKIAMSGTDFYGYIHHSDARKFHIQLAEEIIVSNDGKTDFRALLVSMVKQQKKEYSEMLTAYKEQVAVSREDAKIKQETKQKERGQRRLTETENEIKFIYKCFKLFFFRIRNLPPPSDEVSFPQTAGAKQQKLNKQIETVLNRFRQKRNEFKDKTPSETLMFFSHRRKAPLIEILSVLDYIYDHPNFDQEPLKKRLLQHNENFFIQQAILFIVRQYKNYHDDNSTKKFDSLLENTFISIRDDENIYPPHPEVIKGIIESGIYKNHNSFFKNEHVRTTWLNKINKRRQIFKW